MLYWQHFVHIIIDGTSAHGRGPPLSLTDSLAHLMSTVKPRFTAAGSARVVLQPRVTSQPLRRHFLSPALMSPLCEATTLSFVSLSTVYSPPSVTFGAPAIRSVALTATTVSGSP